MFTYVYVLIDFYLGIIYNKNINNIFTIYEGY